MIRRWGWKTHSEADDKMNKSPEQLKPTRSGKTSAWVGPLLLMGVLLALFLRSLDPDFVVFSNDGPLGIQMSAWLRLPQAFSGSGMTSIPSAQMPGLLCRI